ncbi:MAG: hypothetical protein JNL69_02170, partial [Bacteroidia bacterium]|nr:hypothetical protein [Bacteroidia bacterium]
MIESNYFRVNKKEYCHITDDYIFIFNSKQPTRIPKEHDLGEGWGIMSILNYIFFAFIFLYNVVSIIYYGSNYFINPINYAALFLLYLSMKRIMDGLNSSRTPTIQRSKIKSTYLKTPAFSYPRFVVYFEGPEGKVLKRIIPILYKKEAQPLLEKLNF